MAGLPGARLSRVSALALTVSVGLMLGGCAKSSDPQATLCTSAVGETPASTCDGPTRVLSLTMPRAELLTKVPVSEEATAPAAEPAATVQTAATSSDTPSMTASADTAPRPAAPAAAEPPRPGQDSTPVTGSVPKGDAKTPVLPADSEPVMVDRGRRGSPGVSRASVVERKDHMSGFSGTLADAIRRAIADHPLISLAGARVNEAMASIGVAESSLYPQVEGRLGGGHGVTGTYQDSDQRGYWADKNAAGAVRGEASLTGRQLLFDFGATRSDVAKSAALHDSETLKLREQTESVSGQVSDIYLKILEQRELLSAATENVTALEKIVKLVEENEKNGNGTVADMKRVRSRLIDGQSGVADAKSELQTGSDRFARLVHSAPGTLHFVPFLGSEIPKTPEAVVRAIPGGNPRILALEASLKAARHEIDAQKASVKPKLAFETDVGLKEYRTLKDKTEVDAKGLLVLKYKFLDGGLHSSQLDQLHSRFTQAEMRMRSESDDIEADVRKQYRILNSARSKSESLRDNVATSLKARQLYDEQFRGGKRTLLELLDIQTTYYTARRSEINNKYEAQRAINAVLLAMGKLTSTMLGSKPRYSAGTPLKSRG